MAFYERVPTKAQPQGVTPWATVGALIALNIILDCLTAYGATPS